MASATQTHTQRVVILIIRSTCFDIVWWSNALFKGKAVWHLHLKPCPLQPAWITKWSMRTPPLHCQQHVTNVLALQNACTSTNISGLFIIPLQNMKAYQPHPFCLESNRTITGRYWADDRWRCWRKEKIAIWNQNYLMFNIRSVSF